MKKRILSILMVVCMVAAMFPAVALAAEGTYGEFTVTGDNLSGVSYEGGVLTVSSAAPVTISQTAGVGSSTTDRIEVTSVANITLNGVNIDVSSTEYTAAFRITSSAGEVNITLATGSTNTLKSGLECAGLQKDTTAEGTMLTIDGTGTLNAIGKDDFNYAGSGIGGGYKKAGSYITIAGGTVNAIGGQRCAGIGGGHQATGSSITITGGTVNATGGNMGAGIGGGSWSTGSNITISGGTVNAIATGYAEGIGKGGNGTGSTNITITGGNVKASSIGGPPTNGVANVYQAVIPIAGDTTGDIDVNSMTFTSNGSAYTYNMTGTKSILESGTGKVYVYLPGSSGGTATSANYGGITYVATVKNDNKAVFAPPSYSITYNLDGGTNNVTNPATYNVATATITLANATKTGYTFAGWFDAATDGNRVNEIALGSTGAKTLYARWTQDTYDITYNLDGGTNGANPGTYNVETATITLADATKTDYAFAGWFDAATDGNRVNEIALGSTGDKTLYARWTPDTYTITYNLNGGMNGANPGTYNVETATITLADATKTGYAFVGWFDAATDGNRFNEIALGSTGDKALYARWTPNTYTITYNLDGGTNGANPGTYNVETATITLADATKTGYAFAGWFDAASDGNRVNEIALGSTGDKTLYARWTIISSGGGSSSSSPGSKGAGNSLVTVNGKSTSAGTEIRTTTDGISTNKVQVNNEVVNNKIKEAIEDHSTNVVNTIQISSSDKDSEVLSFELTGDTVKKLEENDFEVSVNNNDVEYIIPAKEFTISKVAEALNIIEKDLQKIKVEVRITKSDDKAIEQYNQMAKANGSELVFPPVSFEVVANTTRTDGSTGKVVISKFSNYVERVMEIPAGVDRNKITTGVVFNQDGTYSHVPTQVLPKDGKWYAKVSSLTNSTYSVIWNPIEVKSVEKHWSRDAVNDMASRLVVFNTETFAPNMAITRADFAEYIVRALGLYREGSMHENKFKDVSALGDRTLAILIANEYGIVSGYQDGTFKPDARITREEAMTMYQRAMKVTNLLGADTDRYQAYTDYNQVAGWAKPYVKDVLSAHVFNGKTATTISPKSNLTYGEAAQAIKNLLVESKLINK